MSVAYPLIQTARGMCTDEEPHVEIDKMLAKAVDAAKDLEAEVERLERELTELRPKLIELQLKHCFVCNGLGAIPGFWLGSAKTCPACHGRGRRL